jgi:hypothetical protein
MWAATSKSMLYTALFWHCIKVNDQRVITGAESTDRMPMNLTISVLAGEVE